MSHAAVAEITAAAVLGGGLVPARLVPMTPRETHELLVEFGKITERVAGLGRTDEEIKALIAGRSAESAAQHAENVARLEALRDLLGQLPLYRREFLEFRDETERRLAPIEAFMQGIQTERDRRRWLSSKAAWLWGFALAAVLGLGAFYDRLKDLLGFGATPPH